MLLLMQPIKISDKNHQTLLQLKLDWHMKSVDKVITKLLAEVKQH